MVVITIANGKGGVGKTTSAVFLACSAKVRHPESSVVLVDLDPQRSALEWSNLAAQAGDPFPFETVKGSLQKLHALQSYDYVIVDTAPAVSDSALGSLSDLSDLVVVPTEAEGLGLAKTYQTIDLIGDKGVALLTRARPQTRIFTDAVTALDGAGVVRFDNFIRDSVRYKQYGITPSWLGDYPNVWAEIEEEISR